MSRRLVSLCVAASGLASGSASTVIADVPSVAVDIAPVHSLVSRVMDGVGTPNLIMPPGASPHDYRLRPSEAASLQDADLVFWIGEDLTPWLEGSIETLASNATVISLLEADGTKLLEFREGVLFEAHSHAHDEKDTAAHDHGAHDDDHADHADDDHAHDHAHDHGHEDDHAHDHDKDAHDHEDHAEADGHDGHDHGAHDPHVWLSLQNASGWLNVIAAQLSAADPDNAGAYFANAAAAKTEHDALAKEIYSALDPVRGGSFIVFHDAYQYFEVDFDIPAAGAISIADASDPSPARIAEIQTRIRAEGVDCVLAEPQFNPGLVATVLDGTQAATSVIDVLGVDLEPGPMLYPQLLRNMAATLVECL